MDDVDRLRDWLGFLDTAARSQPWDAQRPWRVRTHLRWEGELPTLDGHDLSARNCAAALRTIVERAEQLDTGAVRVVTGRGTHSVRAGGVLSGVVREVFGPACEANGWRLRPHGPGAWVLVTDSSKAPDALTGAVGWGCWALVLGLVAAVVAVLSRALGWW